MSNTERINHINQMLNARRAVPIQDFLEELEISKATFKRELDYMRDRLHAPIIWDPELRGYRYDKEAEGAHPYELPGMWFNDSEVYALLIMEHMLEDLQPGLLTPHIEPLRTHIRALLDSSDHSVEEIQHRIRILPMAARHYRLDMFEEICQGLLARKRLQISQYSRQRDEVTQRDISPQRIIHYRDNWYLDAWCHLRNDLRTFSIETIQSATLLNTKAKSVSDKRLDAHFLPGYGIFSGAKTQQAKLRFTPERARWVSGEIWHPDQKSHSDKDGYYFLELPYSNEHELIMDILKYGPDIEVLEPKTLRTSVKKRLQTTLNHYK
ncbi:MAG: WYL domain-containing protein [Proteobacteria bacterium]|nr:WYL domain-containing protein [Pseudomonadota bacterium]NOG60321.1 WYL domain-containing protein [Pseudomonadota bacterium]